MGDGAAGGLERSSERREAGAVLVMVAIWLIGLLALASLAVDGGLALVKRREVRNAADHAALEAAWASCHGEDPQTAADLSVSRNGYQPQSLTLTALGDHIYRAQVDTTFQTGLAAVVGKDTFSVSGVAVADCTSNPGGVGSVIWAGGDNCWSDYGKDQLTINGSLLAAEGRVHSNGSVAIPGSNNIFEGPLTHVGPFDESGSGNTYSEDPTQQAYQQMWPWGEADPYVLADYRSAAQAAEALPDGNDYYVNGDIDGDHIIANGEGLYYATGNIKLDKSVDMSVTLVAEGFIEISGSSQTLHPYWPDGLLAYGAKVYEGIEQCDKFGVSMSGSDNEWSGTVYAPASLVEFAGSTNNTFSGSLVAYSVRIPGSAVSLLFEGTPGDSSFTLRLTE